MDYDETAAMLQTLTNAEVEEMQAAIAGNPLKTDYSPEWEEWMQEYASWEEWAEMCAEQYREDVWAREAQMRENRYDPYTWSN